jgi:hypothetical protein
MAIGLVLSDLKQPANKKTLLRTIIQKGGGMYKTARGSQDSVIFNIYTDVTFSKMSCHPRHGLSVELSIDSPPGKGREKSAEKRSAYWDMVGKKRLQKGGLVGFLWNESINAEEAKIYLGIVTSSLEDLKSSAKNSPDRITIRVVFFDSELEHRIVRSLQEQRGTASGRSLLIEAPVMYESIRPFLETLKCAEPSSIPFAQYLSHPETGDLRGVRVGLPKYARRPGYEFNLSSLFGPHTQYSFRPSDNDAVSAAREKVKKETQLDPSQADALIDTLVSEVRLVQG